MVSMSGIGVVELGHRGPGMDVRVDQARQDHLAVEVDQPRVGTTQRDDRIVGTHSGDPIAGHRDRLVHGKLFIHRHDDSVMKNQVGRRSGRPGSHRDNAQERSGQHSGESHVGPARSIAPSGSNAQGRSLRRCRAARSSPALHPPRRGLICRRTTMNTPLSRREFVHHMAKLAVAAGTVEAAGELAHAKELDPAQVQPHRLTVISGKPRERGRQYGHEFRDAIREMLDREFYSAFSNSKISRDDLLGYAGQCAGEIRAYSPEVMDELEGMADGAGLKVAEAVLMTLHEELWHRGVLPSVPHCTAIATGPPDTNDGNTYVGQTWDWMPSVYGLSSMLLWKRSEGPDLLGYAYPGLWAGAGMNDAGIALCWTSGGGLGIPGPRVGIPSYVLIAQMLYQPTLDAAIAEARRARHAGWFTFVLADGEGRLANVEGTPRELAVETGRGRLARVLHGTRKITGTPEGEEVKVHARCQHASKLLGDASGRLDRTALQGILSDHHPADPICNHNGTLDAMLFNTSRREAWITRGPACSGKWRRFDFNT